MSIVRVLVYIYENEYLFKKVPIDKEYEVPFPFEEVLLEECTFKEYKIPNDEYELLEFEFDEEKENISFMKCNGPSSECCFFIKKSNRDFFIEATYYMNQSLEITKSKDDKIKLFVEDHDNYSETRFEYHDIHGLTDLMTFALLEVKCFSDLLPFETLE